MNPRRAISILGLTGLFAALVGGCDPATHKAQEVQSRTANAVGVKSVEIRNKNGKVVVRGALSMQPKIKVTATKWAKGTSTDQAKRLVRQVKLKIYRIGDRASIVIKHPKGSRTEKYGADIEVLMPVKLGVDADTLNGSVRVLGVQGKVAARTKNGLVELRNLGDHVTARSINGKIVASGKIKSFDLKTVNGGIRLFLRRRNDLEGASSARTTNGGITVTLGHKFNARLSVETKNGSITAPFSGVRRYGKSASGKLGKGGQLLSLATVNGSVTMIPRRFFKSYAAPQPRPQLGGDSQRPPGHHGHGHSHGHMHHHPPRLPMPPARPAPMTK